MSRHKLAVFGNPVAHSLSPQIHALFAEAEGLDISYERILVPEGEFVRTAHEFLEQGTGFNITVPLKGQAFEFADTCSQAATNAQAVNTISRAADGTTRGDNTDGGGIVTDLAGNLNWPLAGQRILVLGAGGAVSGILADLLAQEPKLLHIHNRTHAKAEQLVTRFAGSSELRAVTEAKLEAAYDLVINGTSAGLAGEAPSVPPTVLAPHSRCYDMVYGAAPTAFMAWARDAAQCEVADGLGMLVEQAALAFEIWFGRKPQTRSVIEQVRANL